MIPESSGNRDSFASHHHRPHEYKLPRVDFPKFEGEHPRILREKCEKYFATYHVSVESWIPLATMNFDSNSSLWLQTYEAQHAIDTWADLCLATDKKFGRELYPTHMGDLLTIRQTSDVLECAARFDKAKHV